MPGVGRGCRGVSLQIVGHTHAKHKHTHTHAHAQRERQVLVRALETKRQRRKYEKEAGKRHMEQERIELGGTKPWPRSHFSTHPPLLEAKRLPDADAIPIRPPGTEKRVIKALEPQSQTPIDASRVPPNKA